MYAKEVECYEAGSGSRMKLTNVADDPFPGVLVTVI